MGQTIRNKEAVPDRRYVGEATAVTVPAAALTTIASIPNPGKKLLCFHFDVATQDMDNFDVYAKSHKDAQLVDFTPADWNALVSGERVRRAARSTTSTGALVDGALNSVTTLQNGYFEMDVDGLEEIIVQASAAVNNAAVTPRWTLS